VRDDHDAIERQRIQQRDQIAGAHGDAVRRRGGPLALAMAAQIRRDQSPAGREKRHQWIPPVRVAAVAVDEQHRGRRRVAPLEVVQAQIAGRDPRVAGEHAAGDGRDETRARHPASRRNVSLRASSSS
jgi:hypothetical protein